MCRLFGFRSVLNSQVHRSLLDADNALSVQSAAHPDGWGVAYYQSGFPHVVRSASTAVSDAIFARVSGVVASETVLAHVRRATQGSLSMLNAHPFQFGPWVFAHNGNLRDFDAHRDELRARIMPAMRRFVLGETDSELIFHLLLGHMERRASLTERDFPFGALVDAVRETVDELVGLVGELGHDGISPPTDTFLTFLITNGRLMLGHQGGKALHWSTWKRACPDRDVCSHFAPQCEAATANGYVNHLLLSSEPLLGENVWFPMQPGEMVAVDGRMRLNHLPAPNLAATRI